MWQTSFFRDISLRHSASTSHFHVILGWHSQTISWYWHFNPHCLSLVPTEYCILFPLPTMTWISQRWNPNSIFHCHNYDIPLSLNGDSFFFDFVFLFIRQHPILLLIEPWLESQWTLWRVQASKIYVRPTKSEKIQKYNKISISFKVNKHFPPIFNFQAGHTSLTHIPSHFSADLL